VTPPLERPVAPTVAPIAPEETPVPTPPSGSIRARVLAGETLIGTFVGAGSPIIAELCARAGFEWLIVDLEHGYGTEAALLAQLHAIGDRSAALVRPASGERLRIGRALDLGAEGIMVPRLETVAEVSEVLPWLRFPPDGSRGLALTTRGGGLGAVAHADVAARNETVLGIIQVESPAAVANAAAIAALDGVDVLFVGPTDLSHSMGIPGRFDDPAFVDALGTVVGATDAAGKSAGILLRSGADFPAYRELGFRFIGIGSDLNFVIDGARGAVGAARATGA
jgi:2-dehydro-3-deoxyglucarate aldolase/4-hydroxy-2-oxoheptanedioate aldolase